MAIGIQTASHTSTDDSDIFFLLIDLFSKIFATSYEINFYQFQITIMNLTKNSEMEFLIYIYIFVNNNKICYDCGSLNPYTLSFSTHILVDTNNMQNIVNRKY